MNSANYRTLCTHLDEIKERYQYSVQCSRLKASINAVVDRQTQDTYNLQIVQAFLRTEVPSEGSLINGLYMVAVASFEEFLRQCVVNAIRMRLSHSADFGSQQPKLVHRNIRATGRFLIDADFQAEAQKIYDACKRLGTCIPGSAQVDYNASFISILPSIIQLETCIECLQDIGIKTDLGLFARDVQMQKILKAKGFKDAEKALQETLKELKANRNAIAHSGLRSSNISESILLEHIEIMRGIGTILQTCLS